MADISAASLPNLAVTDAAQASLGTISHGLDADSAVERLAARKCNDETPSTYPFSLLTTAYEAIDHAFREAFSDQRGTESPELVRQAQQTARECMAELLQGNEFMILTADAARTVEESIQTLVRHVTREAIHLERTIAKECGKVRLPTQDLRRQIREKIATQKPIQEFRQRHLSWAAGVEQGRDTGPASGQQTQ